MQTETEAKTDWKAQKELQAKQRKKENDLKKCETEIEKLENRKTQLEEEMALPEVATNSLKLQELANESAQIEEKLAKLYEKWEELAE